MKGSQILIKPQNPKQSENIRIYENTKVFTILIVSEFCGHPAIFNFQILEATVNALWFWLGLIDCYYD